MFVVLWSETFRMGTLVGENGKENMDLALESISGQALLVYGSHTNVMYKTWSEGGWSESWALHGLASMEGTTKLDADPTSDHMMPSMFRDDRLVNLALWDGDTLRYWIPTIFTTNHLFFPSRKTQTR